MLYYLLPSLEGQEDLPGIRGARQDMESLFEEDEPLELVLRFDVRSFQKTRMDGKYQKAELVFPEYDSITGGWPVRIRARGTFRRQLCMIPPFWLNLKKSGIQTDNFIGINKIKTVIRCRSSRPYENYVLEEYLCYKLYELLSPYSFRTRLLRLKFTDSEGRKKDYEDWAFFIEPVEMMAKRLGSEEIKYDELAMRTVNPEVMDQLAMFQFMIGNTDFSITGRHNVKILGMNEQGPAGLIPVPYDFDFTGFVNTVYSHPRASIPIEKVRDRYFQGPCRDKSAHLQAVQKLRELEDDFVEEIMSLEYLDIRVREELVAYMESFFSEAARENFVERRISVSCR